MSWYDYLKPTTLFTIVTTGIDPVAEQSRGDAADAKLAELNKQTFDSGRWTADQYQQAETDRLNGMTGDVQAQIDQAAAQGAVDGLKAEPKIFTDAVSKATGWTLSFVPWWVWPLGAAVVFFYFFDGLNILNKLLKRKLKV